MAAKAQPSAKPRTVSMQVEAVVGPLRLSESFGRIGGNLTPAAVTAILAEADGGTPARLVDLVHEARQKDGHLQSVLETRELAMQSLEWDIVPPGEKPLKKDKTVAKFCKDAVLAMRSFPQLLAHLSGESLLFGHATSEIMWRKQGAAIVPSHTEQISCRRFRFTESEGRLVFLERPTAITGIDLVESYPGKFIQIRRRVNGDVPVREGLARSLLWAALFRNWGVADWLQLAEMSWKPWRTAKFDKTKLGADTSKEVGAMKRILEAMTRNGMAIYPDAWTVEVNWPEFAGNGTSNHGELVAFMGREMSKAVLGGTDAIEAEKNGSRAASEVRNEIRRDRRDADAMALGAELKRYLLEPMVRMNFGDNAVVPDFFFLTEDPEDLEKFSKSLVNFRTAGLKVPSSHAYEKAGIPAPKDGEEILGDGEPMAPKPGEQEPEDDVEEAGKKPAPAKKARRAARHKSADFDGALEALRDAGQSIIVGGPRSGKTTMAVRASERFGRTARHADDLMNDGTFEEAGEAVSKWLDEKGEWIVEGVAAVRGLRAWLERNPDAKLGVTVVMLTDAKLPLSDGQAAMATGVKTVWSEIRAALQERGARTIEVTESKANGDEKDDA
jgi:phage gp29-like protein